MSTRLGELLVKRGLITTVQLDKAIEHTDNQENGALSTSLVELRGAGTSRCWWR